MILSFTANRPVEHPGGLIAQNNNPGQGGTVTAFNRVPFNPNQTGPATSITWRDPGIFQQIAAAGQTVVSFNVVNVQADYGPVLGAKNGGWASTGIVVQPGQQVWLDTQAIGTWGSGESVDANGDTPSTPRTWSIDADLTAFRLIGNVGNQPILPYGHDNMGISGDPHFIPSGDTLLNFPINYSGPISLACNDDQSGDTGVQTVRVIVTQ